jgi:hypothetical protein
VSNWGGYALAAAVAVLHFAATADRATSIEMLHTRERETAVVDALNAIGVSSPVHHWAIPLFALTRHIVCPQLKNTRVARLQKHTQTHAYTHARTRTHTYTHTHTHTHKVVCGISGGHGKVDGLPVERDHFDMIDTITTIATYAM